MCPNCRAFITSDDKICPYCQAQVGERVIDRRAPSDVLGGLIPHQRFVTMLILLINTGLYVATMLRTQQQGGSGFGDPSIQTLVDFGAKYAPYIIVIAGEWWRLITAAFLHGGITAHPDELVGAVRSRPAGESSLRDAPLSVHLFRLLGNWISGQPVLVSVGFHWRVGGTVRIDRRDDRARHPRAFRVGLGACAASISSG